MIVNSITQRLKNKFNISVGEMFHQDNHKIIGIALSKVCSTNAIVDTTKEKVISFIIELIYFLIFLIKLEQLIMLKTH